MPLPDLYAPLVTDRYLLDREPGEGGMAAEYLDEDFKRLANDA